MGSGSGSVPGSDRLCSPVSVPGGPAAQPDQRPPAGVSFTEPSLIRAGGSAAQYSRDPQLCVEYSAVLHHNLDYNNPSETHVSLYCNLLFL